MRVPAIALTFLCLAAAAAGQTTHWLDVVPVLEHQVLRIQVGDGGEEGGVCSGSVLHVEQGYLLTAAHCVPTAANSSITVDGRDASAVKVNRVLDLAVLKTRLRKGAAAIPLAPTMPRTGSAVAVLGFPFAVRSLTAQVGIVANPDVDGSAWINADLLPGDSGGAIVDTEGRLVAVTSGFRFAGVAHMGRAVPLETIRAFVDEYLK